MKKDMINPEHYKSDKGFEAIDVIEAATHDAPNGTLGMLQGNAIKYLYRLWRKENSIQDAEKAIWYLQRLVDTLKSEENDKDAQLELDYMRGKIGSHYYWTQKGKR